MLNHQIQALMAFHDRYFANFKFPGIEHDIAALRAGTASSNELTTAYDNVIEAFQAASTRGAKRLINSHGYTPLMLAASTGHTEVAKAILEKAAKDSNFDVNQVNKRQQSILTIAIFKNNFEIVQLLLNQFPGINVNQKDDQHYSAIMYAAGLGHIEIIRELADHGAELNNESSNNPLKITPLYLATKAERCGAVFTLLQKGADKNLVSFGAKTPLEIATEKNNHSPSKKQAELFRIFTQLPGHVATHVGNESRDSEDKRFMVMYRQDSQTMANSNNNNAVSESRKRTIDKV